MTILKGMIWTCHRNFRDFLSMHNYICTCLCACMCAVCMGACATAFFTVWCLGVHTLVLVYIHALVICWFFSLLQEPIMFTHYCTLSRSLAATCTACNLHAVYIDDCTPPVCIIICTQKYIEQLDLCTIMYNYSHTTYNRCTHEYKSIHNTVSKYGEGNDMGGY